MKECNMPKQCFERKCEFVKECQKLKDYLKANVISEHNKHLKKWLDANKGD